MKDEKIISALIGLAGACNSGSMTENTVPLIIKALAFLRERKEGSGEELQAVVEEIHAEKYVISPGCATCLNPCGGTSDYDMTRLYNARRDMRETKEEILWVLRETAAYLRRRKSEAILTEKDSDLFLKALLYIGCDMDREHLIALLNEVLDMKKRLEETEK